MKAILSLLCAIGVSSMFEADNRIFDFNPDFDIIGTLPLEVAITIFRLLDPKSLVRAITVRRSWFRIIRSDRILRQRVREQLRKERNESRGLVMYVPVTSRTSNNGAMYQPINGARPMFAYKKMADMPMRSTTTKGQKRKLKDMENPAPKKSATSSRVNLRLR